MELTKKDIPTLERMIRIDEKIAGNESYTLEARTMARHRADQANATLRDLRNS